MFVIVNKALIDTDDSLVLVQWVEPYSKVEYHQEGNNMTIIQVLSQKYKSERNAKLKCVKHITCEYLPNRLALHQEQ